MAQQPKPNRRAAAKLTWDFLKAISLAFFVGAMFVLGKSWLAVKVCSPVVARWSIITADAIITLSLMRQGPRPQPGTRITWPKGLRPELRRRQSGRCVYCGRSLKPGMSHIDHITPVAQGGTNDPHNLQLLCPGCNLRKGARTDTEFRHRYRSLLSPRQGDMPNRVIRQPEFGRATRATSDAESYNRFKSGKYLTPAQKVNGGALATAIAVIVLIYLPFKDMSADDTVLTYFSVGFGLFAGLGVRARAWLTGRDQEQ